MRVSVCVVILVSTETVYIFNYMQFWLYPLTSELNPYVRYGLTILICLYPIYPNCILICILVLWKLPSHSSLLPLLRWLLWSCKHLWPMDFSCSKLVGCTFLWDHSSGALLKNAGRVVLHHQTHSHCILMPHVQLGVHTFQNWPRVSRKKINLQVTRGSSLGDGNRAFLAL